jgi:hypothetical protein
LRSARPRCGLCAHPLPGHVTPVGGLRDVARSERSPSNQNGTYAEIPGSDHLVFHGNALSVTMGHIDDWIARNHVLATA